MRYKGRVIAANRRRGIEKGSFHVLLDVAAVSYTHLDVYKRQDKNIIVSNEKGVCDFPLCRKGFSAARCSQDKPIRVFKLLAVAEYHVAVSYTHLVPS